MADEKIPETMQAAAIDRFGPPSVLKVREFPVPRVGPSEVLIRLASAGVGVWDARIRDGSWASGKERFPLVLGTDGAGTVVARGARVRRFKVADRVWAYRYGNPKGGFYAQYVAVDAHYVDRTPRRLDDLEAGAGSVTGLTALQGIDDVLGVRKGETILVFGASGAVGTLAVQFARWRGARVAGTATTKKGAEVVRRLGARLVFDARKRLDPLAAFAGAGLDGVLALAGGEALERCLELVRPGGRVVWPNGIEPEPRKRRGLAMEAYDAKVGPREFARLGRAVDKARLEVPVAAVYPLVQAARAHERLERGHLVGRIALKIQGRTR
jgi:NADPH:quinone reductase-like Zn-dependent oxidoreductase